MHEQIQIFGGGGGDFVFQGSRIPPPCKGPYTLEILQVVSYKGKAKSCYMIVEAKPLHLHLAYEYQNIYFWQKYNF